MRAKAQRRPSPTKRATGESVIENFTHLAAEERLNRYALAGDPVRCSLKDVVDVRDVAETLKLKKAQQAAWRIQAEEAGPERGENYMLTGRNWRLLNGTHLRERLCCPTRAKDGLRRGAMHQTHTALPTTPLPPKRSLPDCPQWC